MAQGGPRSYGNIVDNAPGNTSGDGEKAVGPVGAQVALDSVRVNVSVEKAVGPVGAQVALDSVRANVRVEKAVGPVGAHAALDLVRANVSVETAVGPVGAQVAFDSYVPMLARGVRPSVSVGAQVALDSVRAKVSERSGFVIVEKILSEANKQR